MSTDNPPSKAPPGFPGYIKPSPPRPPSEPAPPLGTTKDGTPIPASHVPPPYVPPNDDAPDSGDAEKESDRPTNPSIPPPDTAAHAAVAVAGGKAASKGAAVKWPPALAARPPAPVMPKRPKPASEHRNRVATPAPARPTQGSTNDPPSQR